MCLIVSANSALFELGLECERWWTSSYTFACLFIYQPIIYVFIGTFGAVELFEDLLFSLFSH